MTTDIHTHLGMGRTEVSEVNVDNLEEHVDMLISRMDTFGIDKAVLTPHEPIISTDLYMQASEIYPDRLFSACSIVPRPIGLAKQKLHDFIDKGCVALVLDEHTYHPRDPAAETLVYEAVRKDIPIYIHSDIMTSETISFLNRISILHMRVWTAFSSFRPHMANAEPTCGAREPAIRDQRNLVTHALAIERGRC